MMVEKIALAYRALNIHLKYTDTEATEEEPMLTTEELAEDIAIKQ